VTTALDVTLVCDIMMDLEGSIRPAMYLAAELVAKGYTVSMMSPIMSDDVEERLRVSGIMPINLRAKLTAKNSGLSMLWFETWAREAFLKLNSKHVNRHSDVMVNFSHTLVVPSMFWYLQGPTSVALKDMEGELTVAYRFAYRVLRPLVEYADGKLVKDMGRKSAFVVANSKFCASMYRKWEIEVSDIIYPPIDCKVFQPRMSSPSSDYVLTYFGKETKFSVVKAVADLGVSIKAFGSKAPFVPRFLITHPNIEFLGRVSTDELVDVYSNALFTLFPFTHEPFGYIPVESMACGTPTLTYDTQGPSESVADGHTGWLAKSDEELVYKALKLWKQGYASRIRLNCVKAAPMFDKKLYVEKWLKVIKPESSDFEAKDFSNVNVDKTVGLHAKSSKS
jgi:glycosyltransferase involved in cell wall biosynthesis